MTLFGDRVTGQPVPFQRLRMKDAEGALQEGVVGATDLKVSQRGAGANMSVDVAAGAGWIRVDTGTRNGLVHVYSDAIANVEVNAAHATLPRVDRVGVRYNDTSIPTGSGNTPDFWYGAGTATSGAQVITNGGAGYQAGALAVPNDVMLLGEFLVGAAATSVTTANIVDRRPWARGAAWLGVRASGDTAALSATTWTDVDSTNLKPRIETSAGALIRLRLSGSGTAPVAGTHWFAFSIDGDLLGASTIHARNRAMSLVLNESKPVELQWWLTAAAGSHTFSPIERASSGSWSFFAGGANGGSLEWSVDEIVRPSAANT
jgi:hypothetical protein